MPNWRRFGEARVANEARNIYDRLKATINRVAWDGKWYLRAISEAGRAIGNHTEAELDFLESANLGDYRRRC